MSKIIKSAARCLLLLVGITFLSFLLMYISPGDPAEIILSKSNMIVSDEALEAKREELGLNEPFLVRYKNWLTDILHGDMGVSYKTGRPVFEQFKTALPNTLAVTAAAMLISTLISIPSGMLCACKKDGFFDRSVRVITYLFASLPSFFLALILMYLFCIKLRILPVVSSSGVEGAVLPCLVLALPLSAWCIRQSRSIFLKELEKDYVTGLRFRGISERRIMLSHVLKNSAAPLITMGGMSFGTMLGGSAIAESIFSYNGIGKLAVDAISYRDYPVIQAFVLWMAVVFLAVNFLVDILCRAADPRIRMGEKTNA